MRRIKLNVSKSVVLVVSISEASGPLRIAVARAIHGWNALWSPTPFFKLLQWWK